MVTMDVAITVKQAHGSQAEAYASARQPTKRTI